MALTKVSTGVVDMSGNTGGLVIAKGTEAQRPASPSIGMIRESTETIPGKVEVYTDNSGTPGWQFLEEVGPTFVPLTVDYLVVAGGGGGGNAQGSSGSGGGAGEYLYQTGQSLTTGGSGYTVTVGAGGSGGTGSSYPSANGLSGSDSFFVRSVAGGGAGLFSSPGNLLQSVPGGSGGGARPASGSGAASTAVAPGVGNAGGSSSGNGGGGGGGAGSPGTTGTTSLSGSGGNGLQNSITGVSTYYAGGGAGGNFAPTGGSIGSGGSGIGGTSSYTGTAGSGVNNTGSGGAGGSYNTSTVPYNGGNGAQGIVILRFPISFSAPTISNISPAGGLTITNSTDVTHRVMTYTCTTNTTVSATLTFA